MKPNACCFRSKEKFPQSVLIWGALSSAGFGSLRFIIGSQDSQGLLYFSLLPASAYWQTLCKCWFHFPAGLDTWPCCQKYQCLLQWILYWPPDLSPVENLWSIVKRRLRPLFEQADIEHLSRAADWLPPCQLHWCCNLCKRKPRSEFICCTVETHSFHSAHVCF